MTQAEYFLALRALLEAKLVSAPSAAAGRYEIKEVDQPAFYLDPKNLTDHVTIVLEKLPGVHWPCFKLTHAHANKRCDRIVVCWSEKLQAPLYVLCELKSDKSSGAWTQIQTSLAFCHFVHRMLGVNVLSMPTPRFGAITVRNSPSVLKLLSLPTLPPWRTRPEQKDCLHLDFPRQTNVLPLRAVVNSLESAKP